MFSFGPFYLLGPFWLFKPSGRNTQNYNNLYLPLTFFGQDELILTALFLNISSGC